MVKITDLSISFEEKKVLDGLTLTLEQNQVTTLMGISGCGKTTFAYLLLGLLQPDTGVIEGLSGKRLSSVFQEDRLCSQLSAIGNIRLVLDKKVATSTIIQHLDEVDLDEESITKPVSQLSGGQKRTGSHSQSDDGRQRFHLFG
jgi:NitT/TauT family transport system ATP-binding protein